MSAAIGSPASLAPSLVGPPSAVGARPFGWWGMMLLIATEAALFACLLASYFYLRNLAPEWPPGGIPAPELRLAGLNTAILLLSSVPMHLALSAIRKGRPRRMATGLVAGFLLGVAFLSIQALEYQHMRFTVTTNAYGSLFITITGFHGAHVLMGLAMNAFTQFRAAAGHFDAHHYLAVENTVLYWHFVDAVWVAVFSSLYLSPHLL